MQGTEAGEPGEQVVIAQVPTAELRRYAVDLRSRTGGRGAFSAHHDHYDVMPPNLVDAIANGTAMSGVASVPT